MKTCTKWQEKIKEKIEPELPDPIKYIGVYPIDLKIGKNRVNITLKVTAS